MTGLWLSWVGLALAPLLYMAAGRSRWVTKVLDWAVVIVLAALILFVVMPDIVRDVGLPVVVATLIGFVGPGLIELRSHRVGHGAHVFALIFAMLGLFLHALVDGMALHPGAHAPGTDPLHLDHTHGTEMTNLGWAVVVHRLPVALAVWSILSKAYRPLVAFGGLMFIGVASTIGWAVGPMIFAGLSETAFHVFEAFVAGSLLHVVVHRPHSH